MEAATIDVSPAAGPLTLSGDPLSFPTTMPPMIPATMPEKSGAPEASAMPRHSGNATRKTIMEDLKSVDQYSLKFIQSQLKVKESLLPKGIERMAINTDLDLRRRREYFAMWIANQVLVERVMFNNTEIKLMRP